MKDCCIPSPEKFRNQCTGIGQTRAASERTGAMRSACVSATMPPEQRKHAVGYPPLPELIACGMAMPVRKGSLRR